MARYLRSKGIEKCIRGPYKFATLLEIIPVSIKILRSSPDEKRPGKSRFPHLARPYNEGDLLLWKMFFFE
jgi:hypothetical protein